MSSGVDFAVSADLKYVLITRDIKKVSKNIILIKMIAAVVNILYKLDNSHLSILNALKFWKTWRCVVIFFMGF
jgi:hypothetical protein